MIGQRSARAATARLIVAAAFLAAALVGAGVPVDSAMPFGERVLVGSEFFAAAMLGFVASGGWKAFTLAAAYRVDGGRFWAWALLAVSGGYAGVMLFVGIAQWKPI